jgi:ubiquinone biosynthesis protein UbiJ
VIVAAADVVDVPVKTGAAVSVAQPNVTTTVTAPSNDVTIVVPALATAKTVQIEYNPVETSVAANFVQKSEPATILKSFEINLYDDKGVVQENVTFINPLTLRVNYTQADLDAVAGDFASLRILQYVTDQWVALNTSIDFVNKELSAVVTHLSYFAIGAAAVEEAVVVETVTAAEPVTTTHRLTPLMTPPGVGGTAPSPGILLAMALVAVVFISSGAYYLKQTRYTATEE